MNKLSGLDSLTDEAFEQMTEEQQMIVESFFSKVYTKISNAITGGVKKLSSQIDKMKQETYQSLGFVRDLSDLIIEQCDNIISFYSQAIVQSDKLRLREKNLLAKKEMDILINHRKTLLKQRSLKGEEKVNLKTVVGLFLKFSFYYPTKMFFFSKNFFKGLTKENKEKVEDCGVTLAASKVFQLNYFLGILAMIFVIVGILTMVFNFSVVALATTAATTATAAVGSVVTSAIAFTTANLLPVLISITISSFKILWIATTSIFAPLKSIALLLISACEDTNVDTLKKQKLVLKYVEASMTSVSKQRSNLKGFRGRVKGSFKVIETNDISKMKELDSKLLKAA